MNKEKTATDKLAKLKRFKDVASINNDFQRIQANIPDASTEEKFDCYCKRMKPSTWKELCIKDYNALSDLLRNTLWVMTIQQRVYWYNSSLGPFHKRFVEKPKNPIWWKLLT